jgi:hypothetical protein
MRVATTADGRDGSRAAVQLHSVAPFPQPWPRWAQRLGFALLDGILALTWRWLEPPHQLAPDALATLPAGRGFACPHCQQRWSIPSALTGPFAFRCDCGHHLLVHPLSGPASG